MNKTSNENVKNVVFQQLLSQMAISDLSEK